MVVGNYRTTVPHLDVGERTLALGPLDIDMNVPRLRFILTAAVALPFFGMALFVVIGVGAPTVEGILPAVDSIGGTDPSAITGQMGTAVMLLAIGGPLSILGAVVLFLYVGGSDGADSGRQPQQEPRGRF